MFAFKRGSNAFILQAYLLTQAAGVSLSKPFGSDAAHCACCRKSEGARKVKMEVKNIKNNKDNLKRSV